MSDVLNWCEAHGVQVDDGIARLYKTVRHNLRSIWDPPLQYLLGIATEEICDEHSYRGIHLGTLEAAAFYRVMPTDIILECLVPVEGIRLSDYSEVSVRAGLAIPVRIVPEEEYRHFLKKEVKNNG